jgi:hypothetical protein
MLCLTAGYSSHGFSRKEAARYRTSLSESKTGPAWDLRFIQAIASAGTVVRSAVTSPLKAHPITFRSNRSITEVGYTRPFCVRR